MHTPAPWGEKRVCTPECNSSGKTTYPAACGGVVDSSLKHKQAVDLLTDRIVNGDAFVSVQVLNEFTVNAVKKGKKLSEVEDIVARLLKSFTVFPLTGELTMDAFRISNRYQFSFWDSLIVASALEAQCSVLYTEDLQNGQIIEGVLEIKNPFIG